MFIFMIAVVAQTSYCRCPTVAMTVTMGIGVGVRLGHAALHPDRKVQHLRKVPKIPHLLECFPTKLSVACRSLVIPEQFKDL